MKNFNITFCFGNHWMEIRTIKANNKNDAIEILKKDLGMWKINTNNGQSDFLNLNQEFDYIYVG